MIFRGALGVCLAVAGAAFGQASDLLMLANPNPNTDRLIVRESSALYGSQDDRTTGNEFDLFEQDLALRYGAILNDTRELYLTFDAYYADTDNNTFFDGTLAPVPDDLYDFGFGAMYRQTVHEDWRVGGMLRIGSASDKPFHSLREMYARGVGFLQIPHLEYTSFVFMLGVQSDLDIPVFPGFGYQFPVSRRAMAIVGLPITGAGGQITDRLGFNVVYWPVRNLSANLTYQATDQVRPYLGFRWRGRYFSRAGRTDHGDRIVLEDKRVYVGSVFQLSERWSLDVQGGFLFDREFGEGGDVDARGENNVRIEDTPYGELSLGFTF